MVHDSREFPTEFKEFVAVHRATVADAAITAMKTYMSPPLYDEVWLLRLFSSFNFSLSALRANTALLSSSNMNQPDGIILQNDSVWTVST